MFCKKNIFISHSSENKEIAEQLCAFITRLGIRENRIFCSSIIGQGVNNGEKLNEHVFWEDFSKTMGEKVLEHMPLFEDFYSNDFDLLSTSCGYNEKGRNKS